MAYLGSMLALCGVYEAPQLAPPEHGAALPTALYGFRVAFKAHDFQRAVYMAKVREKLAPFAVQLVNLGGDGRPPGFQSSDDMSFGHGPFLGFTRPAIDVILPAFAA
ncbi:MAG: hypothetical protein CMI63_05810 [Parvularcula sp.]|nr:hypothetical protein [Parvularcula sp.]